MSSDFNYNSGFVVEEIFELGHTMRVSMGLTVNRQMAKKLTVNRQKQNIFTVNRQMNEPKLDVKSLRYP